MPAEPQAPLHTEEPSAGGWQLPLIVATLLGLVILAGILWLGRPENERATPAVPLKLPPLGPEERAYLPRLEIREARLSRWRNFLGQEVTYLDFEVANRGRRTVLALQVTIEFRDALGQTVLRERLRPVGGPRVTPVRPTGPLGPGETRKARAGFEHIPVDWDRRQPDIRVTGLLLQ